MFGGRIYIQVIKGTGSLPGDGHLFILDSFRSDLVVVVVLEEIIVVGIYFSLFFVAEWFRGTLIIFLSSKTLSIPVALSDPTPPAPLPLPPSSSSTHSMNMYLFMESTRIMCNKFPTDHTIHLHSTRDPPPQQLAPILGPPISLLFASVLLI